MRLLLIANPENRRAAGVVAAARELGWPIPVVLAYEDLLCGQVELPRLLGSAELLRIESPGENWHVKRQLIALGAAESNRFDAASAAAMAEERGRVCHVPEWFAGYRRLLGRIDDALRGWPGLVQNQPAAILRMIDKWACQEALAAAGVRVPERLGLISGSEELHARMDQQGIGRVFIKLRYGSSASGVIAYRRHGSRVDAIAPIEMHENDGEVRLYNSLKVHRYREARQCARLIDTLAREGCYAERWLPKASVVGGCCDLRLVVIGGRARHAVVRVSTSPMTNLHLGNRRGSLMELRDALGEARWQAGCATAEAAVQACGGPLVAGVDLLLSPGFGQHAVAEVNAFGDLLPGILDEGETTCMAGLRACREALLCT